MASARHTRSFADDLIARGVNKNVAQLFTMSTGLTQVHQQSLTQHEYEQFVGLRAPMPAVPQGPGGKPQTGQRTPKAPGQVAVPIPGGQLPLDQHGQPTTAGATTTGSTGTAKAIPIPGGQLPLGGPGGNGSSRNGGATGVGPAGTDWTQYLSDWGFTDEMKSYIQHIFATESDPQQAARDALAYIRGTDWYKQHFPGIGQGIQNGMFTDESSYRAYVTDIGQWYQRYTGRAPTSDEISQYIAKGYSPAMVGQHLAGQAYINDPTNRWNVNYQIGAFDSGKALTPAELSAYGDTVGGLNNASGDAVAARVQAALQKFTRIFEGISANPAMTMLSGGQLATRGTATKPDVGA